MNTRKPVTFEDRKLIQLEMLKEIDVFCRANDIKYSLAFGTLLGAIRHNGFIPWDDDVDIMMPLPDMLRFKELFHSSTMKYCDLDTEKYFRFSFARIADTRTFRKEGILLRSYGVCIDLYTVVSIPSDKKDRDVFFQRAARLEKRTVFFGKWRSRAARYLSLKSIPFYRVSVKKLTDYLRYSFKYGESGYYYVIAGPINLHDKMTYDFDMFEKTIDVVFEGHQFMAISEYDRFLSLRYGDYMTPPPEEQRYPYHGGSYYWG